MHEVIVSPQVARMRPGNGGSRNALLASGQLITFTRRPTYLEEMPPEVEDDAHLVVREVPAAEWTSLQKTGAKATDLRDAASPAKPAAKAAKAEKLPPIPDDFADLSWPKLQKLGGAHGVTGKKVELIAGLEAKRDAASTGDDGTTTDLRPERLGEE